VRLLQSPSLPKIAPSQAAAPKLPAGFILCAAASSNSPPSNILVKLLSPPNEMNRSCDGSDFCAEPVTSNAAEGLARMLSIGCVRSRGSSKPFFIATPAARIGVSNGLE
jgi:hypothetical protein